jgi:hypothetical protein
MKIIFWFLLLVAQLTAWIYFIKFGGPELALALFVIITVESISRHLNK